MSARVVAARTPRLLDPPLHLWLPVLEAEVRTTRVVLVEHPTVAMVPAAIQVAGRPDPPVAPLVVMVAPGAISAPRADHRPAVVAEAEAEVLDSATASPEEVLWLKVGPVVVVPASPGQLEMELAEAGAVDTPVAEAAWG